MCGSSKPSFGRRPVSKHSDGAHMVLTTLKNRFNGRSWYAGMALVVSCMPPSRAFVKTLCQNPSISSSFHRQNLPVERIHERVLHTSLVRCGFRCNFSTLVEPCIILLSEPTVFENYVHDLCVDEQLVELSLWDTAGGCDCAASWDNVSDASGSRAGGV